MGADTQIEWADHTFNPWTGCTKVSPACDHCYAEAWAKRTGHPERWKGERALTSPANWRLPAKWNKEAATLGVRKRVFCASLADVFDNEVNTMWRAALFDMIKATPQLDWLLLTKRIGQASKMLPPDWGTGYPNVWLGATVINQEEYDRDTPKLLAVKAKVRFLSIEPMLGPINLRLAIGNEDGKVMPFPVFGKPTNKLHWAIVGGESGGNARPMHPDWARDLRDQCNAAGTPFLFKQWGEWAPGECCGAGPTRTEDTASYWDGKWLFERLTPKASREMHIDDEPDVYRVGKKRAGRMLDGRTWDEFPT